MSSISVYAESMRPLVNLILIVTPLGSVLVPLILTLFFFSTSQSRRHLVFTLNILACCSGICEAVISVTIATKTILYPLNPISKAFFTTSFAFALVASLFSDSILMLRVLAFYPLSATPNGKLFAIFALPILAKCGRLFTAVMYLYQVTHVKLLYAFLEDPSNWSKNPYMLVLLSLQVIDNSYTSGILLYKIHQFRREHNDMLIIKNNSLLSRLRSLLIIALGNFIFPIIINITSIILIATSSAWVGMFYVFAINNYVSIIGIVFATIWTRRQYWNKHDTGSNDYPLSENGRQSNRWASNRTRTVVSTLHIVSENEEGSIYEGERISPLNNSTGKRQGN